MRIDDLVWLPDIVDKLATKHNVLPDEVEEVFRNLPRFRFVESGHVAAEDVYSAEGQTDTGRYLVVFFILKVSGEALILSAREMTARERKRYGRK